MIKNVSVQDYFCDQCGIDTDTRDGNGCWHDSQGHDFCLDCAIEHGLIDPLDWLNLHGISLHEKAEYKDGKVIGYRKWGRGFMKDIIQVK